tara:strand:+ start:487 stop:777 length:291 start_codon:yes stop_codon:yes gene_type:complete
MKELGMSWSEIKKTPRFELTGLLAALNNYQRLHQYDGYDSEEISQLAKDKPSLRSDYAKYLDLNARYESRAGNRQKEVKSFSEVISGVDKKYKKQS